VQTMTYHTRKDLLYQYGLADAFTVCDRLATRGSLLGARRSGLAARSA
jgi:phospholipase C